MGKLVIFKKMKEEFPEIPIIASEPETLEICQKVLEVLILPFLRDVRAWCEKWFKELEKYE